MMFWRSLVLSALGLLIFIGSVSYLMFETIQAAVIAALIWPGIAVVMTVLIYISGRMGTAAIKKRDNRLSELDPEWKAKLELLLGRLNAATYRWQWREFGDATRAFTVDVSVQRGVLKFGNFNPSLSFDDPAIDRDFTDKVAHEAAVEGRKKEVQKLGSGDPESLARLHVALDSVLERTVSPQLRDAFAKENFIEVSSLWNEFIPL